MSDETREDKAEAEADIERDIAALEGLLNASVELDCPLCGLNIHPGDAVVLADLGWAHPVCGVEYADSVRAEARHDRDRERGD